MKTIYKVGQYFIIDQINKRQEKGLTRKILSHLIGHERKYFNALK